MTGFRFLSILGALQFIAFLLYGRIDLAILGLIGGLFFHYAHIKKKKRIEDFNTKSGKGEGN